MSNPISDSAAKPRPSKRVAARGWVWAAAGSFLIHAGLVTLLVQRSHFSAVRASSGVQVLPAGSTWEVPDWIDVTTRDERWVAPVTPPEVVPPPIDLRHAAEGERDKKAAAERGPRVAAGRDPAPPAPDHGDDGGRLPSRAWRRDQSTLHQRLTDGALESQPSRQRLSPRSTSPQAARHEPVTGSGDSIKTSRPSRLPEATQFVHADDGASEDGQGGAEDSRAGAPTRSDVARIDSATILERGEGPLDGERAPRAFDTERRGPATDNLSMRSASDEKHPSLTDFSHAGAVAAVDQLQGQGVGEEPGANKFSNRGSALNDFGAAKVQQVSPQIAETSQDRRYQRYYQEIRNRVNSIREFPKSLALRLEQGETIVTFVVSTDGKISDGVRVVKSSGFDEFDSAARRAVLRAAPFPPMPDPATARPVPISVRVTFENPLVR